MSEQEGTTPRASILLVDDTPANLFALSTVLKPLGARIVEASSGAETLECVSREPFAVVLLDVQMPDLDGFEVARSMRQSEYGRDVPIVFITAIHDDKEYARLGYAVGAADYLTKPLDVDVLRARVKAFVDLFQQREEVRRAEVALRTQERDEAVRRLVAFERIATAALDTDDLGVLLRQLLNIFLCAASASDSAAVLLREGDELETHAVVGLPDEELGAHRPVRIGEGFFGAIAAARQPLERDEVEAPRRADGVKPPARGPRGLYGVPLLHEGELLGVAFIGSTRASRFSDAEKRLFGAMAERAAWAVARHRERSRLYEAFCAAPGPICVVRGPELRYEFANPACRALFGGRELVGTKIADTGVDSELLDMLFRVHRTGETIARDELPITACYGSSGERGTRHFSLTLQPVRDSGHEGVLMFANDVTAQVRARRELEAHQAERAALLERERAERAARAAAELASRTKDQFLGTISHELRTPLNAILGWISIAQRDAPPTLERALAIIERNARTQARIIDDVLDVTRIVSGKLRLDLVPTNLADVIHDASESIRPAAEARGVEISITIDALEPTVGDPERLQQVVWNLLSNSVKFTPKGGKVELSASREGQDLVLRVSDTGQGVDVAFLPHIFDAFRQADGSTTRRYGGLGLGLAIAKQLVLAHSGSIHVASDGPGKGATFTVRLPIRAVPSPLAAEGDPISERAAGHVRLSGLRVLVVEDEEDARTLLQRVLEDRGATVTVAASSEQALDALERCRPDVIVSDVGMPGMDGYDLIRSVRALPPERGGRTPAIALTAYGGAEDSQRAFSAGFQRHLPKPVNLGKLVAIIATLDGV
ncbi:response regulator [Sorangium sp. So ce1128]